MSIPIMKPPFKKVLMSCFYYWHWHPMFGTLRGKCSFPLNKVQHLSLNYYVEVWEPWTFCLSRFCITCLRSFPTLGPWPWPTRSSVWFAFSWCLWEAFWWEPSTASWAPSPRASPYTHGSSSRCSSSSTATWLTSPLRSSICLASCRKSERLA